MSAIAIPGDILYAASPVVQWVDFLCSDLAMDFSFNISTMVKVREHELANVDANRQAVGMLNPMRHKTNARTEGEKG